MIAPAHARSGSFEVSNRQLTLVRALCVVIALVGAVSTVGLYREEAWAIDRWPLPDVRMTHIFMASIAASIAAPAAWIAWRQELGALRSIAFELMIGAPVLGGYLLWLAVDRDDRELAIAGIASVMFGVVWAALYWWSIRVPLRDTRSLPGPFRVSFAVFCAILCVVGGALTLQVDNVFPWEIAPESSTIIGLIFLSAAVLFGWIVAHPAWAHGEMALTAFLAYDLVLVFPYLDLWRNREDVATISSYYGSPGYLPPEGDNGVNELSLVVYLMVLAVSFALAIGIHVSRFRKGAPGVISGD